MSAFGIQKSFRVARFSERFDAAFDASYAASLIDNDLTQNIRQGALDSYGFGTVTREFLADGRNPIPANVPMIGPILEGAFALRDILTEPSRLLSKEEYEASDYYRDVVPWAPDMTEDRAAALAEFADMRAVRQHFAEKQPVAAFLGQLIGQAVDPINYVPVFGPAAHAAAIAKAGSIAGRAAIASAEAAVNTAAFSVLTSRVRERLGDDTSFEMLATEIATSALIGGIFGSGIGVFMGRRDRSARRIVDALDTMQTKQEARAILNDATRGMVYEGKPSLSRSALVPMQRIADEVRERVGEGSALYRETQGIDPTKAKPGEIVVSPASQAAVAVRPEVVELSTLQHATGGLQVRDRSRFASDQWVEETALTLNPAKLLPDISADRGAPLVGEDNIIDSGNGRVMAIRRAAEAYPEKYAEYVKALDDAGYNVEGFAQPVLISRRVTPLSDGARRAFNAEANSADVADLSPAELAQFDRDALTPDVMDLYQGGDLKLGVNREFVARFMATVPRAEAGKMLTRDGGLNSEGVRRLENAMVARAYGDIDPDTVVRFTEEEDGNVRTIIGAMADAAGEWSRMRAMFKRGDLDPEWDMTPELTKAMRLISRWRTEAARDGLPVSKTIKEGMGQPDLIDGDLTPDVKAMIRLFYKDDEFTQANGRERVATFLKKMAKNAEELGQPQIFGTPNATKLELIQSATYDGERIGFASPADLGFGVRDIEGDRVSPDGRGVEGRGADDAVRGDNGQPRGPENAKQTEADLRIIGDEPGDNFPIRPGQPFRFVRNTEGAHHFADPEAFALDPEGRWMLYDEMPDNPPPDERWEKGEVTFRNPLYLEAEGWKERVSEAYDGKSGEELSAAMLADGYDGIVTFDQYGPSEIVDMTGPSTAQQARGLLTKRLMEWADAGDIEAIKASPELEAITADMVSRPTTDQVEGFGSVEWAAHRTYNIGEDGRKLTSVLDAVDYLVENARTLASKELGVEPFETAKDRKAVIVIGPPAAGKSTIANQIALRMRAAIPDADEAKKIMPEYDGGMGSNATHEESSLLATAAMRELIAAGDNMIIPKVGGKFGSIEKLTQLLHNQGYEVDVALMDVPPREAFRRMIGRFVNTGRLIPPKYFDEVVNAPREVFEELKAKGTQDGTGKFVSDRDIPTVLSEGAFRNAPYATGEEITGGRGRGNGGADAGLIAGQLSPDAIPEVIEEPLMFPEPSQPDWTAEVEARVGRPETFDEMAESYGVDRDGGYVEQADIEQLAAEGRLTPEDQAALSQADKDVALADAYGKALEAARSCVM